KAPEPKPAEAPPADAKPAETKPPETPPAEAMPAEAKPPETPPAEAQPAEPKPAEAKPAEAKPAEPPKPAMSFTRLAEPAVAERLELTDAQRAKVAQLLAARKDALA